MKKAGATVGLAQIMSGALPQSLIQFPSGRWGFVGRVDARLAYTAKDGSPADPAEIVKAKNFGPALANVKTCSWATAEEAIAAAEAIGATVTRS